MTVLLKVFTLLGGLAFFLYGMNVMSGGLGKLAGGSLERSLKTMTKNRFAGMALGAVITIAIQSSSAMTVMLVGLAMGTTVSIARAVGAGDRVAVSRATGNTVTLFAVVSLVLTAVLLLLVRPITAVMSTPAEAVNGTAAYLTICFCGIQNVPLR